MHQSVYDKALAIFQEGARKLEVKTKAIDRERVQSTILHKLEERKIKQDLLMMIKDKNRYENDTKRDGKPIRRRENTFAGKELHKKRKMLQSHRSLDSFPPITCTSVNIPKIMRRNLSNESEFHNWVTGLPKIGNRSIVALEPVARTTDAGTNIDLPSPRKAAKDLPSTPKAASSDASMDQDALSRRFSKVSNIVYSVPIYNRNDDTTFAKSYSFPSNKQISSSRLTRKREKSNVNR